MGSLRALYTAEPVGISRVYACDKAKPSCVGTKAARIGTMFDAVGWGSIGSTRAMKPFADQRPHRSSVPYDPVQSKPMQTGLHSRVWFVLNPPTLCPPPWYFVFDGGFVEQPNPRRFGLTHRPLTTRPIGADGDLRQRKGRPRRQSFVFAGRCLATHEPEKSMAISCPS